MTPAPQPTVPRDRQGGLRELSPGLFGVRRQAGAGLSFLGIHGWGSGHEAFDPLLPHLPPDVDFLALDQPGFGASADPRGWSLDAYTQALVDGLDAEGVAETTAVGICAGAVVAMELALSRPERVRRLVLVDPFAYVPWYFALLSRGWLGRLFYHATFANPLGRLITNLALASKRNERTDLTQHFRAARHEAAFRYLGMVCEGADVRRYRPLTMPITILVGARTFSAVRRSVGMFREVWPQAEAHTLEGAGHLPVEEAPARIAEHAFEATRARAPGSPRLRVVASRGGNT